MQRFDETVDYEIMADSPYLKIILTYINFQTIKHEYIIIVDLLDHNVISIEYITLATHMYLSSVSCVLHRSVCV